MASALINSHPNQFRFLRATYQPKGHEGLLAGKASKMMRSCFPCRVEILQEYSVMPNIEQHSLLWCEKLHRRVAGIFEEKDPREDSMLHNRARHDMHHIT